MLSHRVLALVLFLGFSTTSVVGVDDDVLYYLYNKETGPNNPVQFRLSTVGDISLDASRPLKILCHGYLDGIDSSWYASAVSEYLTGQNVNIIAIDWPATDLYSNTVSTARQVALVNGKLIQELVNKKGVDLNQVHLIGHSLGAHISGLTGRPRQGFNSRWWRFRLFLAGQEVLALTGKLVGRITGLDPAGPGFNYKSADQRLSEDDAVFVEAIHTDGNVLGYGERLAHADYFPNGGVATQPGCSGSESPYK